MKTEQADHPIEFIRCEIAPTGPGSCYVYETTYLVLEETPKGYWIRDFLARNNKRFVLKSARKKFAYPTRKEALYSLYRRKRRHVSILRSQLEQATIALSHLENLLNVRLNQNSVSSFD